MSKTTSAEDRLAGRRSLRLLLLLLAVTLLTVFVGEVTVMSLLTLLLPPHTAPWVRTVLDAALLALLVTAVMLPLMLHLRGRYLRQARKALRLQYTLDKHAIVSITDPAGNITFANDRFCEISGYSREELLGRNHRILKSGLHDSAFYREMWNTLSAGRIWHGDLCNRTRDGGHYWVRATITPFLDQHGRLQEYVAIRTDITEQRQLEQASRQQEARFRMILDNLGEGVYTLDAEGMVTYLNREGERLLGWQRDELQGRPLHDTIHHHRPDGRPMPANECPIRLAVEASRIYRSGEEMFFRKDGSLLPVKITGAPLLVDGIRLGSVAVFADASEERLLKQHLLDAKRAAEQAVRLKSDFLSTISHEIRTPLNGVIGMTDLLLETRLDGEQTEFAQLIKTSADALMAIVNDILDLSKIEAGRLEIEITDFSLRQVVESTLDVLAGKGAQKNLLISSFVSPELPDHLQGDPTRIRQILLNFLSNAIKFTDRGEVVVSALPASGGRDIDGRVGIRFSVRDTGIGLNAAEKAMLFQPFVQSDSSTTRKYGGTGLGLSICKRLAVAMAGSVGVDSTPGAGSCFHADLSLVVGVEKRQQRPAADLLRGRRVLLAGADPGAARVWASYLAAWRIDFDTVARLDELDARLAAATAAGRPYALALLAPPLADGELAEAATALLPAIAPTSIVCCLPQPDRHQKAQLAAMGLRPLQGPLRQSILYGTLAAIVDGDQARRGRRAEDAELVSEAGLACGSGQRLLLAEDNRVNQRIAVQMLERLGYAVDVVGNGALAVEAAALGYYQLVLMDCQMPEMDGFAATRAIRQGETATGRRLPIVAMTANALAGDRELCIEAGMDDYLAKPIDVGHLADTVATWLARADSRRGASVAAAGAPNPGSDVRAGHDADAQVLDLRRLHEICGNDEDDVERLLGALDEAMHDGMARLRAGAADNPAAGREIGHELRGLAHNVGATKLGDLAGRLEQQSRQGERQEVVELVPLIICECERLTEYIARRTARQKA